MARIVVFRVAIPSDDRCFGDGTRRELPVDSFIRERNRPALTAVVSRLRNLEMSIECPGQSSATKSSESQLVIVDRDREDTLAE